MVTNFQSGVASFGSTIHAITPTLGKEYHVRKEADDNYGAWYDNIVMQHYDSSLNIQVSIEAAVEAADDFDTIWVYPGEWVPSGTLAVTQKHLKLLAADMGPNCGLSGTEIWQLTGTNVPIITLNGANNVEIAGFRLIPYNAADAIGISVGETTECKGTWIHDNILYNLESVQASSIRLGASGVEAQYTLIENNYVYCGGNPTTKTGQIDWVHATRSMIRNNNFMINQNSANVGCITVQHEAYIRGHILNNTFWGMAQNTDDMVCNAVHVDAAAQAGDLVIDGNHTYNLATPFSSDLTLAHGFGLNYLNHSAIAAT